MEGVIERERQFWNACGREHCPFGGEDVAQVRPGDLYDRSMPWLPYLGLPAFNQCLLETVGDLRGKRVLDLGTGTGFLAVLMAQRGAQVVGVDVAEGQLEVAAQRARISGVQEAVTFRQMGAESLEFPDASFDAVVGSFVLHHTDLRTASREVYRVLAPGGVGAFIETSGRNRLLMLCRSNLVGRFGIPKHGSSDEHPLDAASEECLREVFHGSVRYRYPETVFLRMAAAYIALLRHWPIMDALRYADLALFRFASLQALGYFAVVECRKRA
jgi:ubiquinone/menaquinone biosynthesis C-methylase UbiE